MGGRDAEKMIAAMDSANEGLNGAVQQYFVMIEVPLPQLMELSAATVEAGARIDAEQEEATRSMEYQPLLDRPTIGARDLGGYLVAVLLGGQLGREPLAGVNPQPRPLDMLVVGGLAVLGLDVIVGPVVADLKYLTRKEIRLDFPLACTSCLRWQLKYNGGSAP